MTDPYEHGFEVAQRRRLHLPPEPMVPPGNKRWQRPGRVGWQTLVVTLGVVVLIAIGRAVTAQHATGLKANCSREQISIAEKSVQSRGSALLHWAVTAAPGTRFVVAIDRPEGSVNAHEQATTEQSMSKGCLAEGQFGVLVPPGTYNVSLVLFDGAAERRAAFRTVTVTAP